MSFYYKFKLKGEERRRTAERLLALRAQLRSEVPHRDLEDTLLLATWNLREFDSNKGGKRSEEAYAYIAEIVSAFDLLAIQEVREDLKALEQLRVVLGHWWEYVVTDVTKGMRGNRERLCFLFDTRKIRFAGVAGEVVIPPRSEMVAVPGSTKRRKKVFHPAQQLYRTPFLAGFQSRWYRFMLCTVHIAFGESQRDDSTRLREIALIAEFLSKRADEKNNWSNNMILLGDFNIFDREAQTMKAITGAGFTVPRPLTKVPASNVGKEKRYYDQIAFKVRENELLPTGKAGVLDYYKTVYRQEDENIYVGAMGARYLTTTNGRKKTPAEQSTYYRSNWRTHQMSDHLPMWVELKIDFGQEFLEQEAKVATTV
jgi:endonuclease/exonuclease/phosphatase family metal-dependent hydrolase